ncbi:MAG TPA: LCP family protein [Jatrophihabitans sp.]|jgi:LCP family protein required for cell wall assembly
MRAETAADQSAVRAYRRTTVARLIVATLAFAILLASGYAWAQFQNFKASVPHGAQVPALAGKDLDGADQNILLIGNDSRAGATRAEQDALHTGHDTTTVNTDTMMILHMPDGVGRPSLISFPRDSWVSIPGYGKGKLNSAYSDGFNAARAHHESERAAEGAGVLLTLRTLSQLTGLHIDHYVQINLLGFYRISEAIGGVQVCLLHAQNKFTETDGTRHGFSGINLPAGVSTIEGAQALAFVRQRHGLPHGDLDRIRRQQYFLSAAFRKVASAGVLLNPFKLHDLMTAVSSSLLTDPSLDLLSLAHSFELLSAGQIDFMTLPNNGPQVIYPDGVETAIVRVDQAAIPSFIHGLIGRAPNLSKVVPASPETVTVDVLNGAGVTRLAARNAGQLSRLGFHIDLIDSAPSAVSDTAVQYPPHHAAQAKAVANLVPGAKLMQTSSVRRVTLVLGRDGKQVTGLTTAPAQHRDINRHKKPGRANGIGCIN